MARKDSRHDTKTPRAARSVRSRSSAPAKPKIPWKDLAHEEQLAVVCRLFCAGEMPSAIADIIRADYPPTRFTRQSVHKMLQEAATDKRFRFVPKPSYVLSTKLKDKHKQLADVKVVHTNEFEDVAYQGAETLIELLQKVPQSAPGSVHIGFAGGHAMHRLAQIFSQLLDESDANLPRTLVLHALVAGFDVRDPTTDPNTFFSLFRNHTSVNTQFEFVGLRTPPVVKAGEYQSLRRAEGISESYEHAKDLDIIVTSAANWTDEHSTFRKYMERSPGCADVLVNAGCLGDMLWLPVGPRGPLPNQTDIRSMTLVELTDLPGFIERGKYVLLVLGPCAMCQKTKSGILSGILASQQKLVSHLVVDTRSAKEAMG